MIRYQIRKSLGLRFQSSSFQHLKKNNAFNEAKIDDFVADSSLPFAYNKDTEAFGQLVKNYHQETHPDEVSKVIVRERDEYFKDDVSLSSFRNEFGELPDETLSAQENRLHPNTLIGRTNRAQTKIPPHISKTIYNHILALKFPKVLRYDVAEAYIKLNKDKLYNQTKKPHEVTTHIAAFFAQDYTTSHQVLTELFKRMPDFNPDKVLDVSYGPAVGMIALNEIMGDTFRPSIKHSVILGDQEMQNMAKLLLSRQVNEYPGDIEDLEVQDETESTTETQPEQDFIGAVKTKKIKIRTKMSTHISNEKKYDLIIAQHQLLQDATRFPSQVDENLDVLLKALAPNGVLVLVERGNPLGFENIARARQVMIRPENFPEEKGKVPRPYIKGSTVKPNKRLTSSEQMDLEDYEGELLENFDVEVLEPETINSSNSEDVSQIEPQQRVDYHLSIVAPCAHHKKCPLQTLKPHYYEYPTGKKLNWCKYTQSLERPKYLIELKRGKVLSSKWDKTDEISPGRQQNGTSGRVDANNYEIANYSYLIVQRSGIDSETLDDIDEQRASNQFFDDSIGKVHFSSKYWPRILQTPMKRKGHITFGACASSGEIEKWIITKSFNKDSYFDARKSISGDLWGLDAKTKMTARNNGNQILTDKLVNYEKQLKKELKKEKKLADKALKERVGSANINQPEDMIDLYTSQFNNSNKQKQKDKRGGIAHLT